MVWVKVKNEYLTCYKRWKSFEEIFTIELTFTTIKVDKNEPLVFKLISPKVEAEFKSLNEVEFQSWKKALENAIKKSLKSADNINNKHLMIDKGVNNQKSLLSLPIYINFNSQKENNAAALNNNSNNTANNNSNNTTNNNSNNSNNNANKNNKRDRLVRIQSQYWKGMLYSNQINAKCAECNEENPEWASVNLGILLCQECCGIHRSMGVHISKVKSLLLDHWSEPQLKVCFSISMRYYI